MAYIQARCKIENMQSIALTHSPILSLDSTQLSVYTDNQSSSPKLIPNLQVVSVFLFFSRRRRRRAMTTPPAEDAYVRLNTILSHINTNVSTIGDGIRLSSGERNSEIVQCNHTAGHGTSASTAPIPRAATGAAAAAAARDVADKKYAVNTDMDVEKRMYPSGQMALINAKFHVPRDDIKYVSD
jgi:hypothetical protein